MASNSKSKSRERQRFAKPVVPRVRQLAPIQYNALPVTQFSIREIVG